MATFNGNGFGNRMYGNNKTSDWGGRNDDMFGHEGHDEIYGMRGNDRLFGGSGNDLLVGGEGNDDVFGDSGEDIMTYERGNDTFNGGSGTDRLQFRDIAFVTSTFDAVASVLTFGKAKGIDYNVSTGAVSEVGGDSLGTLSLTSVEHLTFTAHGDIVTDSGTGRKIETFGGSDTVQAGGGNDNVILGDDHDFVDGGRGNDILSGGAGIDEVSFASWNDVTVPAGQTFSAMIALAGPLLNAGSASLVTTTSPTVRGIIETDTIFGFENVTATRFNDSITGTDAANRIRGEEGDDSIQGRGGIDTITGGAGDDKISGGDGADILNGGTGSDTLDYLGSSAGVTMNLLNGRGAGGAAEGDRTALFENINGSRFGDQLNGNIRGNILNGNAGGDTIDGFLGNDTIDGGDGRDFITGGSGRDALTGGTGADDFIFKSAGESKGLSIDTITDFQHGIDRIDLSAIDAISGTPANDSFTFFFQAAVTTPPGAPPAIPTSPVPGLLIVSSFAFDTDDDGVQDTSVHTISGHIDAGNVPDFELKVLTSVGVGLEASDFLL